VIIFTIFCFLEIYDTLQMQTKIKSIVVDHEQKSFETIKGILTNHCPQIDLVGYALSAAEGIEKIKRLNPQLVLLDMEMPEGASFDLLGGFDEINFQLVFISGIDDYAYQAIKFNVMDYIIKPVDIRKLTSAVTKVQQQVNLILNNERLKSIVKSMENEQDQQLSISSKDGYELIHLSAIVYCEAYGSCTWFHLSNGRKVLSSKNLGEFEKVLHRSTDVQKNVFFRTHYKFLVNLNFINNYMSRQKYIKLSTGQILEVACRRSKAFRMVLNQMNKTM